MIYSAIEFLLIFCICATGGWVIEVIYRGIRHRKAVNPGFLSGCSLPMYGVGGMVLYFLSGLKLRSLPNDVLRIVVILLLATLIMTLIEFIGGLIAVKYFRVRLWDYSAEWGNLWGIICPKFTLFWGIICAAYFFLLYPLFHRLAGLTSVQPLLVLGVGFYLGVFTVDLAHSLRIMQRLRGYAAQIQTRLNLEQIKIRAREHFRQENGKKGSFNFYRVMSRYMQDIRKTREDIRERFGVKNEKENK